MSVILSGLSIVAINTIALMGYLLNMSKMRTWGADTEISYPAIISFLLTGIALIIIGLKWNRTRS